MKAKVVSRMMLADSFKHLNISGTREEFNKHWGGRGGRRRRAEELNSMLDEG